MPKSESSHLRAARRHERTCRNLFSQLGLSWSYDPFYYAVSSTVEPEEVEVVTSRLRGLLPHEWTAETLKGADANVRELGAWAGGLQGKQRLFHSSLDDTTLFAALWPWTEDEGCTLRIGMWHPDVGVSEREPLGALLRTWFDDESVA